MTSGRTILNWGAATGAAMLLPFAYQRGPDWVTLVYLPLNVREDLPVTSVLEIDAPGRKTDVNDAMWIA